MNTGPLLHRPPRATVLAAALACGLAAALALPAASQPVAAQPAANQPGCATVEVHHLRPGQGFLMLAAFADATSFRSRPAVALRLPAAEATTIDRKSTRLNSSHPRLSRMPSSA